MKFFATNGTRPIRLSEETRRFAWDSLNGRYGRETMMTAGAAMDDIDGFEALSPLEQYDRGIERIAVTAPIRLCDGEKISGAATFGLAVEHSVPMTYGGNVVFESISHLTIDFETVLTHGVDHIERQAQEALERYRGTAKEPFIRSCLHTIACMRVWHARYLDALQDDAARQANRACLMRVPFQPPRGFREAVQSLWFVFAFVRLCGNWPGIGRIDRLLGDYLERDLQNGVLEMDEAREILAHLFIKGCEWIKGGECGSGDAQHYQNIVLAGVDEHGHEVTNTVTYLVLDILEELGISDFPTSVRVHRRTDPRLLRRVAEVMRLGGGVVAVYNEELVIQSLIDYGYAPDEAARFANDGCWEVQIPGKTCFSYMPFDVLQILQQHTLGGYDAARSFPDFDSLYRAFTADLQREVETLIRTRRSWDLADETSWTWAAARPCTVVSLFEQGCIENGASYLEGGPCYNVMSPHIGGLPDAVNSLYAIKKLVYDDRVLSLEELRHLLKTDWEGHEPLRRYALNRYTYYGNDHDEVDRLAADILDVFADACDAHSVFERYQTPAGVSTFGRQLEWSHLRLATPYGKKANEVLAGNFSPTPGTDKTGATAIIRSYCKADLKRTVSGAALDLKLLPSSVNGDDGLEAIASLIRGFVILGGHFLQLDIADAALLRRAQEHPEDYPHLSVRVSGWNARFVTLSREWQEMILQQQGGAL